METIRIIWYRQLIRYWRSKPRIIGSIGQPLLFLLALGFGLNPVFQKAKIGNYFDFLVPGVVSQAILFMAVFSGIELIWDRQFGFLKETLVAPVSRLEIVLGRTLGGATIATMQGIIVLLISILFGFRPTNWLIASLSIGVMFMVALLYTALGTAIASTMEDFHGFQLIMNFLVMPTFFLSGALFPLSHTVKLIKIIAFLNPLTYGVDALRFLLAGKSFFSLSFDVLILGLISLIFLLIGAKLFERIQV